MKTHMTPLPVRRGQHEPFDLIVILKCSSVNNMAERWGFSCLGRKQTLQRLIYSWRLQEMMCDFKKAYGCIAPILETDLIEVMEMIIK